MKSGMTSRERVLAALEHKETDRAPFSLFFGINEPARRDLAAHLGMKSLIEVDRYLEGFLDLRTVGPEYKGPADRNIKLPDGSYMDIWGVVRTPMSYGAGYYDEISHYPLAEVNDVKELEGFRWPSAEWFDYETLNSKIDLLNQSREHAIIAANGNIFESSWYMRGFERMLGDLVLEPELAWEIMRRVTDYFISYFQRVLSAAEGRIDLAFTADDVGQQDGLILSPALWERMIKPHHARLNKALHEFGVKIMYHTDGAVMRLVPGLIDMGIDILEPLQFDAKDMDPVVLKDTYGDRLCFHGGVSVQKTLPFGTVEQVKEEVKERVRVLGRNGGYILSSSHAVQAGTPPENIVAFLEASRG